MSLKDKVQNLASDLEALISAEKPEDQEQRLEERKKDLLAQIKTYKDQIMQCKVSVLASLSNASDQFIQAQQGEMDGDIKQHRESIKNYEEQIRKEEEKLRDNQEGKREKQLEEVKNLEDQIKAKEERVSNLRESIKEHFRMNSLKNDESKDAFSENQRMREAITGYDNQIANLDRIARSEFEKYGRNIPQLLSQIEGQRWTGQRPVGPFGQYVKLKDPRWKQPLQVILGRYMSSFVVENSSDRSKLAGMLRQSNK